MTADTIRDKLKNLAKEVGGQRELARRIGVSAPFLNDIILSKRHPSGKVLEFLQIERIVIYRKKM